MKRLAIGAIRLYQRTFSQVLPPSCRYMPSCSQYGVDAIEKYGVLRGSVMTLWRIARCNPFTAGGYDPVR